MRNYIRKNLKAGNIILLFILTGIVYTIMLTITIPGIMNFSGGMKILDMMPSGYNSVYVNQHFEILGEEGRDAYLFRQIPFDMVFPLLYAVAFCLIMAWLLNKLGKLESRIFYICLLPLISGLFDYCENIGIIIMLNKYPDDIASIAKVTNIFSVLKSSCTTISFTVIIILLIVFGFRSSFKSNSQ